uniref:MHC class II beta chain N-terminal domain-containing protein n=1 Tax=Taeniopygia guttata TaxID=59729 RepID=H0ZWL2_TAEGU
AAWVCRHRLPGRAGGAPPELCPALTAVLQWQGKTECHFTNGTEKVRLVDRYIYNRLQHAMFDSDVGEYVGFTPYGERNAKRWNSDPEFMESRRAAVDTYCRHNYRVLTPFLTERRGERGQSVSPRARPCQ